MAEQITNYQCPACTGPLHFSAALGKLECEYCGSVYEVSEIEAMYAEKEKAAVKAMEEGQEIPGNKTGEHLEAAGKAEESSWDMEADGMRAYTCPSCGAELVCSPETAASSCPYCGNPTVISGQFSGTMKPEYVIPFRVDKDTAVKALKQHYKNRAFLPKSFKSQNHVQEIQGVYVPFWLCDGTAEGQVSYEAERVTKRHEGEYEVTDTAHYEVRREGSMSFQKVPVDASSRMLHQHMDSIEPYRYEELTAFSTAYLPGYLADKYDVSPEECRSRVSERCVKTLEDQLYRTVEGYNTVVTKEKHLEMNHGAANYALLPVWLLHTTWNGKEFLFAMNGQTGKLVGDLPVSRGRYWGIFAAIAIPVMAVSVLIQFLI